MKYVVPLASRKSATNHQIHATANSRRLIASHARPIGITQYAPPVAISDAACNQTRPGCHCRQTASRNEAVDHQRLGMTEPSKSTVSIEAKSAAAVFTFPSCCSGMKVSPQETGRYRTSAG